MRIFPGEVRGNVSAPPSKSHSHRAIFLSAMADGESVIDGALLSADTLSSCEAMRAFGADIEVHGTSLIVRGGRLEARGGTVDVGNSGTTLRLLSGLASLFPQTTVIDGDQSLRTRPMGPLLRTLTEMGARCSSHQDKPPVSITGPLVGRTASIEGGVSSQFISSLLLAGGLREGDTRVEVQGNMSSRPYVDITISMMERFGSNVICDGSSFITEGGGYSSHDYHVPGDFSSAAFPLVAGAVAGDVRVDGLDHNDLQGDKVILDILESFGADVDVGPGFARVRKGSLNAADVDLGDTPDLFPIVSVLAAYADGESRLFNARHLRFKESDRIATSVSMLKSMGVDVTATDDGCVVRGGGPLKGGRIDTHGDHRIMMAGFVAGLNAIGHTEMLSAGEHEVSYPKFLEQMENLGVQMEFD